MLQSAQDRLCSEKTMSAAGQTLGDTEKQFYERTKKSTGRLLQLLCEHHDSNVPCPPPKPPVQRPEPALPPAKEPWFFVEKDITPPSPPIRIEHIQIACADYYGVSRDELLSPRRGKEIVRPRQVGYFLSKNLTLRTLPQIGRCFRRDHTSALHGIRKIEALRKTDPNLQADLNAIASALGGSLAN